MTLIRVVLLLCIGCGTAAAQSTNPRPMQRETDNYLALLMSRSYDKIDSAADEARKRGTTMSDGQPLLAAIYSGIAGCPCGNQLNEELWLVRKQRIEEWLKRNPSSVTAKVSLAAFPLKYGWMARGGGYANTVSDDAWKLFRERVEEGRRSLEAADQATKQDPGWYEAMLDIAVSQGWPRDKLEAIFEQGVAKHPDYLPLYFHRANYYHPKWHGSHDELRRVVDDSVKRTRPRMGETLYARLYWGTTSDQQMFQPGFAWWPFMKAGFERLVKDYPDRWNVNHFAKFACFAGDSATFSEVAKGIGNDPIVAVWWGNPEVYYQCHKVANARKGQGK